MNPKIDLRTLYDLIFAKANQPKTENLEHMTLIWCLDLSNLVDLGTPDEFLEAPPRASRMGFVPPGNLI